MGPALRTLGLSLWFGGGLAVLFGTRALFAVAGTRRQGGLFSGALLQSFLWLRASSRQTRAASSSAPCTG